VTTAALLARIRAEALHDAEEALSRAELYQHSKRQGLRNSTPICVRRGETALGAFAILDAMTERPHPRHAVPDAAPRRAMTG
jgi:hypothetical protein